MRNQIAANKFTAVEYFYSVLPLVDGRITEVGVPAAADGNFLAQKLTVSALRDLGVAGRITDRSAFGKGAVVEVNKNGEFALAKSEDTNGAAKFLHNMFHFADSREANASLIKNNPSKQIKSRDRKDVGCHKGGAGGLWLCL